MARRFPWLWLGLLAACILVAVLAWQNQQLRTQQQWLQTRVTAPYAGMYVPIIAAPGVDGRSYTLGAAQGQPQVLFFFTTTCPYCRRSAPTVVRAARQLQANLPGRPQLLGVCHCDLAQAARYAHVHGFDFPVVTLTDRRALMLFRARNVPLVMAVDGGGARAPFPCWPVRYHGAGAGPGRRIAPHGCASGIGNGEGVSA